jgi:hypothetical protein
MNALVERLAYLRLIGHLSAEEVERWMTWMRGLAATYDPPHNLGPASRESHMTTPDVDTHPRPDPVEPDVRPTPYVDPDTVGDDEDEDPDEDTPDAAES